jgi:hypothetical protein
MNGFRYTLKTLAVLIFTLAVTSLAQAQATRTWVSGVGDDVNPCSRTAPCKTFAGAISKTAAGGEISALDPAGFGAINITKSITISGDGTLAGILASLVNGVIINAASTDKVILRNISINGAGNGINGIRYLSAKQVTIDKCTISGFTGNGIDMSLTNSGNLYVRDTHITKVNTAIRMATTAGFAVTVLDNVDMEAPTTNGLDLATNNTFANVRDSSVSNAGSNGFIAQGGNGVINVENSLVTNNGTAFSAAANGSIIRISNNVVFNNTTGFNIAAGGTIASDASNKVAGNGGAQAPNATLTKQ